MIARDADAPDVVQLSRPARDFGLVVGIDHYPRFRSLQGAAADAIAFHAWMCDPDGGGVAPEHARLITSIPEPPMPLQDHIDEQIVELVQAADALGGARRLYVYFSGHGATSTDGAVDDVALLLAKWSPTLARLALSSTSYCGALGGLRLFEEVAMFLDCCRTAAVGAVGLPPTFTCKPASEGAPARTFIAYATEAGRSAFEQPQEGVWHGAFTRRLLWILRRSPHGIEAAALKDTLERELREDAVQRAHVVNGLRAGSTFGRRGVTPTLQVKLDDQWEGRIELFDGVGRLVASHPPSEGTWTLLLAMGLYKLTYKRGALKWQKLIDHGRFGPTTVLDFRPRLRRPLVRAWSAAISEHWPWDPHHVQVVALSEDEPVYIGSAPECTIRMNGQTEHSCFARIRCDDGCYVFEDLGLGGGTPLFDQTSRSGTASPHPERSRTRVLRDGDLIRYGDLRLMIGEVESSSLTVRRCALPGDPMMARGFGLTSEPRTANARLSLSCAHGGSITVSDAAGVVCARSEGSLELQLPCGLYLIESELFDRARREMIELDGDMRHNVTPEIWTPVSTIFYDIELNRLLPRTYSIENTTAPLGAPPQVSQFRLFLRPRPPRPSSSERITLHDEAERPLVEPSELLSLLLHDHGGWKEQLLAFSCAVAPGTYYLRASRSRHNVAITIPPDYAARIFIVDVGVARLDDMRVSLTPTSATLEDHGEIARVMEGVIAALRSPGRGLSAHARALLPSAIRMDVCFGIAAAHVLARAEDRAGLEEVLDALAPYAEIPDVAILQHAYAPRARDAALSLTTPPLLRASLQLAMTHPAFDLRDVPADSALARAACRGYTDSIWCTWSHSADDEQWIAPTIAELRAGGLDVVALGRKLGIPPRSVQRALEQLDAGRSTSRRDSDD